MNSKKVVPILGTIGILLIGYFMLGFFVIQPIGALPEGGTFVFWRAGTNIPFISSADSLLLKSGSSVSLLGRAVVLGKMGEFIQNKKILRLPYMEWLYLISTGGVKFEK